MRKIVLSLLLICIFILAGCGNKAEPTPEVINTEAKKEISRLSIIEVSQESGKILILGETDLPTDSILSISFDIAGRSEDKPYIGIDGQAEVNNGEFSVELPTPNHPEFANGSYVVEVMFTPKGQPENIINQVGGKGERLIGEHVTGGFGFNIMKTTKEVNMNLTLSTGKPKPFRESEELVEYVNFIKSTISSINDEYEKQKNNYDQLRWASFVKETRNNLNASKQEFNRNFSVGNAESENVQNIFSIGELYNKVEIDLLKSMWDSLNGSNSDPQQHINEINGLLKSIKLPQ